MKILENFNLIDFNTFHVKAFTRYFTKAENENDLLEALRFAKHNGLKTLLLGEGSNILFTRDFEGLAINIAFNDIRLEEENLETPLLIAEAGARWNDAVDFAVRNGLFGIENLAAIPGTCGAAPVQNIGAYGAEISGALEFVEGYETETLEKRKFSNEECEFGYRTSVFKTRLKNKFVITKIALRLNKNGKPNLNYSDLKRKFETADKTTPFEIAKAITEIRNAKLPLPSGLPNAGSFFKNPVTEKSVYENLKNEYPEIKAFPYSENEVKLSAAQLIDLAGFKGYREGDAGVYEKHALVLVNYGNATGAEIKSLAEKIRNTVFEKFNISLQFEVNVI